MLVVDARDPDAGGLLPAGWRRREVPEAIDLVLAHHADDPVAVPLPTEWVAVERTLGPWHRGERVCEPPPGPVALFTGVSRPGDVVGGIDLPVTRTWVLRDHETPDAGTLIAWAGGLPLVCTEKDRVRLPAQVAASVWWRPLVLRVDDARAPDLEGVVRPRLTG